MSGTAEKLKAGFASLLAFLASVAALSASYKVDIADEPRFEPPEETFAEPLEPYDEPYEARWTCRAIARTVTNGEEEVFVDVECR